MSLRRSRRIYTSRTNRVYGTSLNAFDLVKSNMTRSRDRPVSRPVTLARSPYCKMNNLDS